MNDKVNHPSHYTHGQIECIDAIKSALGKEQFIGFLQGNSIKYLWRLFQKGSAHEDSAKAAWYIDKLKETLGDDKSNAGGKYIVTNTLNYHATVVECDSLEEAKKVRNKLAENTVKEIETNNCYDTRKGGSIAIAKVEELISLNKSLK